MKYSALVVAAGSGSRVGLGYNKMLYKLNNGKTVLEETIQIFQQDPQCTQIIVTASKDDMEQYIRLISCGKVVLVAGGASRQASVYQGLLAVKEEYVLIHDGARPWLPKACIKRLLDVLNQHKACLLTVKVKDTVKQVVDGVVQKTLIRDQLQLAQTPQAFYTELILECHQKAKRDGFEATDDAQIVECYSDEAVIAVEGSYENIKVTTIEDLQGK
ncbi:MAG: 2-C-methyl-D-erythritol 4-phosphate cytidylyltransferase [Erysipelotrichaceae bacterium]|nr:2-C-methyl-D-erythritol 4-phosphate cytidylyltransferase [Erysipelotrichaceae bacterium]